MGFCVSDAVSELLVELHPIKFAFKRGLINYTALARFIKPAIDKRMNEDVGLDAIIMAIRRNEDLLMKAPTTEENLYKILHECKLVLRTGMANVHFARTDELFRKLAKLEEKIDWAAGEKMYVLQRTDELSVIIMSKYLPDVLALAEGDKGKIVCTKENLALLTVTSPPEGFDVPGLFEFLTDEFYVLGINLYAVFSSYSKLSFLFDEAQAAAIYERLATSIKKSSEFAQYPQAHRLAIVR